MIAALRYGAITFLWAFAILGGLGLAALAFGYVADRMGWVTIPDDYSDNPDDDLDGDGHAASRARVQTFTANRGEVDVDWDAELADLVRGEPR